MNKSSILLLLILFVFNAVQSQPNVGFNQTSGAANINIPLYNIGGAPIGLSYQANGIKVKDVSGTVGLGWSLNAGGAIYREVRGKADDTPFIGFFNNGAADLINNINDCTTGNCNPSASDLANLESLYNKYDTDPDIFYINTPFISGQFIFSYEGNNQFIPQTQPFQDVIINYEVDSLGWISSFELIDDQGVKYTFGKVVRVKQTTCFDIDGPFFSKFKKDNILPSGFTNQWLLTNVSRPNNTFVNFEYQLPVKKDSVGPEEYYQFKKTSEFGIPKNNVFKGSDEGSFGTTSEVDTLFLLNSISSSEGDQVVMSYSSQNDDISENLLQKIKRYKNGELISSYVFSYKNIYPDYLKEQSVPEKRKEYEKRVFLTAVNPIYDTDPHKGYSFEYYGVYDYYTKLPSTSTSRVDLYGFYKKNSSENAFSEIYYNSYDNEFLPEPVTQADINTFGVILQVRDPYPSVYYYSGLDVNLGQYRNNPLPSAHPVKSSEIILPGSDRSVDPEGLHFGSISKVTYPAGGNARFFYEANRYYDSTANEHYYGPGIRLNKTILHDGVSNTNNVITNYNYDYSSGNSSGVVLSRPVFAFGSPFRDDHWLYAEDQTYDYIMANYNAQGQAEALSLHTNFNLSEGDLSVHYRQVTVSESGKGKMRYNFSIPGKADDLSANTGEWTPTMFKTVQDCDVSAASCIELGRTVSSINNYPFGYQSNYAFQQDLIDSVSAYNESGNLVSSKEYKYVRTSNEMLVNEFYGVTLDKLYGYPVDAYDNDAPLTPFYVFGRYKLFSNVRNSLSSVKEKTYDPSDFSKNITKEVKYYYDATGKRLSKVTTTNSDGIEYSNYIKYVADYDTSNPTDDATIALNNLKNNHQLGITVENYSTVKKPGGNPTVISAQVTEFDDFNKTSIYPKKIHALNNVNSLELSSFYPSNVSGGNFNIDSHYSLEQTVEGINGNGIPSTVYSNKLKQMTGVHWGYTTKNVIASIDRGHESHFVYAGFEEDSKHDLTYKSAISPQYEYFDSRAILLTTEGLFKGSIYKESQTKKFKVSLKLKSVSNAGTLSFKFYSMAEGASTPTEYTVNFQSDPQLQLYETEFDVTTLYDSLLIGVTTDQDVYVDDIVIYPVNSLVTYRSYDTKGLLQYQSQVGGTTAYYLYDNKNRNTYMLDDDKKIVSANEYFDETIDLPPSFFFKYDIQSSTFIIDDPDLLTSGYTLTFDFGDGNSALVQGSHTQHTYVNHGTYEVTLKAEKEGFSDQLTKRTIGYTGGDVLLPGICIVGPKSYDLCESTADDFYTGSCKSLSGPETVPTYFEYTGLSSEETMYYDCEYCELEPVAYSWKIKKESDSAYYEIGTEATISIYLQESYRVILEVTMEGNLTYTSPEPFSYTVTVYQSNPNCETEN